MLLSLKQLLSAIVDYAGLFPPAQLSLPEALAIYDRAWSSPHHWMLGHFVVPASRLPELIQLLPNLPSRSKSSRLWPLSVILSPNWLAELKQIRQLSHTTGQIAIRALEVAPLPQDEIQQVHRQLPTDVTAFFEIPFGVDLVPYLKILQPPGTAAKLRTGGLTNDAFPDSTQLAQRLLSLAEAQIPLKATAGLHHPLRGQYRLTSQADSASVTMHGFLNVLLVAALAYQGSISGNEAVAILEERSRHSFQFTDMTINWREHSLTLSEIKRFRQQFFHSFGSCSIQEPIADLDHLELL
ncbi:hypothetical protein IQ268_11065 [Oculatella sp. LEGE 06141]|uniref:hypothetical protein n=1 Tax=Oculatella sp. LEGE 06141 TaxID=1828648 RepID=UPI0018802475|nr:hypothetical protein [Oculatella sp. LEGE 06141]MBE9179102.1 hypothetical protein [Oculatella sp. LEGE 06141]